MLTAGQLTAHISIQRDETTMQSGAEVRTTQIIYQLWANPMALSGSELWRAQQVQSEVTWRFAVRYSWRGKILSSDRVIHRGESYEIVAVVPDDLTRDAVVLLCKNINA